MMYDAAVETRSVEEQYARDNELFKKQLGYLLQHSEFYKHKLAAAGITDAQQINGLEDITRLPFTEKDEIRATQAACPPYGAHLAVDPCKLRRVFSTSGTTGVPCYLGLTQLDLDMYATNVARGYTAAGFRPGQSVVVGFNAGPFVAGGVYYGFDKIGCNVIPVGTGNTERMVTIPP